MNARQKNAALILGYLDIYKLRIMGCILVLVVSGTIIWQAWYLSWPLVQAEVLGAQVNERMTQDSQRGEEYPLYQPEIRFRYLRENGQCQLATGTSSFWSRDRNEAERVLTSFRPGVRVEVRRDPKHPEHVRFDVLPISESIRMFQKHLAFGIGFIIVSFFAQYLHRARRIRRYSTKDQHRRSLVDMPDKLFSIGA